jgi:PEP-CTERM motif
VRLLAAQSTQHFINNNITQKLLYVDPYSEASSGGIGGVAVDTQNFSTGTISAPATNMGIQHSFTLTGGDSATMNSTFTIVPEPATMALAALGALGLVVVRARRRE